MSLAEEQEWESFDVPASVAPAWVYTYDRAEGRLRSGVLPAAGRGPTILLVHGQPGSGRLWGHLPAHLSELGEVVTYDRPGWGANREEPGDLARNAESLCELAGSLPGPVILVGYSYGGAVALEAVALGCGGVDGLVLVAPAANARAIGPLDRAFEPGWIARVTSVSAGVSQYARGRAPLERALLATHSLAVESSRLRCDLAGMRTSRVRGFPVSIVAGLADRTVPPSSVAELARRLDLPAVRWSAGCGHLLPLRRPRLVARAVASVLGQVSISAAKLKK